MRIERDCGTESSWSSEVSRMERDRETNESKNDTVFTVFSRVLENLPSKVDIERRIPSLRGRDLQGRGTHCLLRVIYFN